MSPHDYRRAPRWLPAGPAHRRGDRALGWFLAGYAGVAGFLVIEAVNRDKGVASSVAASPDDQTTTRMIMIAYALAAGLPVVLRPVRPPQLPRAAGPAGLILQVAGLGLRVWSMRELGQFYSRTLRADADEQSVVETGPYRLIRHPGYAGSLLVWAGFAMASRSTAVVMSVAALLARAYQRRIAAEEELLRRTIPGYDSYTRRTKRLVPYVW